MGTIPRETYTKPLPADAEIITRKSERLAEWADAAGNERIRINIANRKAKGR